MLKVKEGKQKQFEMENEESIVRISDGSIFAIGNKVYFDQGKGKITLFYKDQIHACITSTYFNGKLVKDYLVEIEKISLD